MLAGFVWFENSQTAVNMDKVLGFGVFDDADHDPPELHFWLTQTNRSDDDMGHDGYIVRDQADIRNFLTNVAQLDHLPPSLNVSQVVGTVEAGASVVGLKIDTL
jgi:hypothetical protein